MGLGSIAALTALFLLITFSGALTYSVGLYFIANVSMTETLLQTTLNAIVYVPWIIRAFAVAAVSLIIFRSHLKVDSTLVKRQLCKVAMISAIALSALLLCGAVEPAIVRAETFTAHGTDTYLSQPPSFFDWFIGKFSSGTYFAINGSNWNDPVNVYSWQISPPWVAYKSNATALQEQCLSSLTYGVVYGKEVAFNYSALNIPANVSYTESVNGRQRTFINSTNTEGSPYTISVGSGADTSYYFAQDSADRYLESWSSTNASYVINSAKDALTASRTSVETIKIKGSYILTNSILFDSTDSYTYLDCTDATFTKANGANCHLVNMYNTQNVTINGGNWNGNRAGQSVALLHNALINASQNINIIYGQWYNTNEAVIATVGISATWSSNINIMYNVVKDAGSSAEILIGDYTKDSQVSYNTVLDGAQGIVLGGYLGLGVTPLETINIKVLYNSIITTNATAGSRIYLYGGSEAAIIEGNYIDGGPEGYGIEISEPDNSGTRHQWYHRIAFNYITNTGQGISLCWDYGLAFACVLEGNVVNHTVNTAAGTGGGYYIKGAANCIIKNNVAIDTKEESFIFDGVRHCLISGNSAYMGSQKSSNGYAAFQFVGNFQSCDSNIVEGNECSNSGVYYKYGIADDSDANNDKMIVRNNIISDAQTKAIYITSLQAEISGNLGYVTEKYITATIGNNEDVPHGLVETPDYAEIHFNGVNYDGGPVNVWVDLPNSSATNLRVHASYTNGTAIAADAVTVLIFVRCNGIT